MKSSSRPKGMHGPVNSVQQFTCNFLTSDGNAMERRRVPLLIASVACLLIVTAYYSGRKRRPRPTGKSPDCSFLYQNETLELISEGYRKHKKDFDDYLNSVLNSGYLEGNTGMYLSQHRYYHHLVKDAKPKTICEIGFNAGHSTLIWLTASPDAKVYSFDIGRYEYTRVMAEYLDSKFPGRLKLIYGNSLETVPKVAQLELLYCDMIVIDGGHDYEIVSRDLQNMKAMASAVNIVVFDDYSSDITTGTGRTWHDHLVTGSIKEIYSCEFKAIYHEYGGFAVGHYNV